MVALNAWQKCESHWMVVNSVALSRPVLISSIIRMLRLPTSCDAEEHGKKTRPVWDVRGARASSSMPSYIIHATIPPTCSALDRRFFSPPLIPRIMSLPTCAQDKKSSVGLDPWVPGKNLDPTMHTPHAALLQSANSHPTCQRVVAVRQAQQLHHQVHTHVAAPSLSWVRCWDVGGVGMGAEAGGIM